MDIQSQSVFIFTLLLCFVLVHKKLGYSILNPFSLFVYMGMLFLGVAFIALEQAMTPLKPFTWLVIVSSWLSFIGGIILVELSPINKSSLVKTAPIIEFKKYNWKIHLVMTYLFFGLSMLAFIYTVSIVGTTVLLSGRGGKLLHGELVLPYPLIYFFSGCIVPCTLALFGAFRWNPHPKLRKVFAWTFLIFWIISFNFWGTRVFLLLLFTFYIGLRAFNGKDLSLKYALVLPFFAVSFFLLIAFFQTGEIISQLVLPYQYIANNIWNLDYAFDLVNQGIGHSSTYGHNILSGLGYMLPNGYWAVIQEAYGFDSMFNESIQKVRNLNTISYQWYLFKDLGWPGVIFGSFFWGFGTSWLWKKNLYEPTPLSSCLYIIMIPGLVLATTGAFWTASIFIYWIGGAGITVWISSLLAPVPKKQ